LKRGNVLFVKDSWVFVRLRFLVLLIVIAFGLIVIAASGGGGSGDDDSQGTNNNGSNTTGISLADLAGSWYGVEEDKTGTLHKISITVDGSGNITQILEDGKDLTITATITKYSDQIFTYSYLVENQEILGAFFIDANVTHAGIVTEDYDYNFAFMVVQKSASSIPTYAETDIEGNWAGYGVSTDYTIKTFQTWTSDASVLSGNSFSGSNGNNDFSGSFGSIEDYPETGTYGVYFGLYTSTNGPNGDMETFLSPDKTFAASWVADESDATGEVLFPDDYSFEIWSKQNSQ
jgi:hypothetical protein